MNEDNEITMRDDLVKLLDLMKEKIESTDAETELDPKKKSKFSQYVDGYEKLYKLLLADTSQGFDQYIQEADKERRNCEYLEDVARKNRELDLKKKELEIREKEYLEAALDRKRDLEIKQQEVEIKEQSARNSGKWWNAPIAQTGLACAFITVINISGMMINNSEFPIKNIIEKWMQKPNIRIQ